MKTEETKQAHSPSHDQQTSQAERQRELACNASAVDPSPTPTHLPTRSEDQQRQTEEGRCKADGCANETCAEAEEPVWVVSQ